jgi:hypothetical protein
MAGLMTDLGSSVGRPLSAEKRHFSSFFSFWKNLQ